MRTVPGPTGHVVVVGAGLGGLAAAMSLTSAGREVTVVERDAIPGGRAGRLELDGYSFDTGPTVLTLPGLLEELFAGLGESLADWVTLDPLSPAYRTTFADGSTIDVLTDVAAMADHLGEVCGAASAAGYLRFVEHLRRLYDLQRNDFIDRNFDSPAALMSRNALRLLAMGGFRKLEPVVRGFLPDERLQRIFSFQAMYAGLSPYNALAIYAVISYMDCVAGVVAPKGGMHAVPQAMAAAVEKHGGQLRYSTEATRIEFSGDRAVAVHTGHGERIGCDAVVVNADIAAAWATLLADRKPPWRFRSPDRLRWSPSCVVLHIGSRLPPPQPQPQPAHHTIHFGQAWSRTFRELIEDKVLMSDPSLLVSVPTVSDPSLAPPDRSVYYVLAPTPNLDAGIDWATTAPAYRERLFTALDGFGYGGFADAIEVEAMTTPADWGAAGLSRGTPFALSHTLTQTGPFRPGNLIADNVVLAGMGTRPGVGVPMVLISGRLAAERITGGSR